MDTGMPNSCGDYAKALCSCRGIDVSPDAHERVFDQWREKLMSTMVRESTRFREQTRDAYIKALLTPTPTATRTTPMTTPDDRRPQPDATGIFDADARIAADWGDESAAHRNITCDTMIDARVVKPIDTSTTAGKIAVMQAYDRGEAVQAKVAGRNYWSLPRKRSDTGDGPCWDWTLYDYRIAPPEPTGTALDAAREYMRDTPPTGDTADQKLRDLVKYIRSCPVDEIRGTIGLSVQPGRYRLVRDES